MGGKDFSFTSLSAVDRRAAGGWSWGKEWFSVWGGGARRRQEACRPVAGAGATQYRSLFGGMGAADLLLELGRREGGFVWRTDRFDAGIAAASKKEKRKEG